MKKRASSAVCPGGRNSEGTNFVGKKIRHNRPFSVHNFLKYDGLGRACSLLVRRESRQ